SRTRRGRAAHRLERLGRERRFFCRFSQKIKEIMVSAQVREKASCLLKDLNNLLQRFAVCKLAFSPIGVFSRLLHVCIGKASDLPTDLGDCRPGKRAGPRKATSVTTRSVKCSARLGFSLIS